MQALRPAGHTVTILTGLAQSQEPVTEADVEFKRQKLSALGLDGTYDNLVVLSGPENTIPYKKVLYMRSVGGGTLIDNSEANARAASAAGILALVPWATRVAGG